MRVPVDNLAIAVTMRSRAEAPADVPVLRPGSVVGGKYVVLQPLGAGAMGQVWAAENMATGAAVVLKALHPDQAASEEARALLRQEARAMARLQHRGIVRVFDLVDLSPGGPLVIVMERLRGATLAAHLATRGRMSIAETMEIVLPVLSALAHAHEMGIVHRDLKPENVFLSREPDGTTVPKILDFGLAKSIAPHARDVDRDGIISGTPLYMSPEQARGDADLDARSDVFAAGVMLYEMLSGATPFLRDAVPSILLAVLDAEPPVLSRIPDRLWLVVQRALAKRREDRPASALALARALTRATAPQTATPPPELPVVMMARAPAPLTRGSSRALRFGLAGVAAIAVAFGGFAPRWSSTPAANAAPTKGDVVVPVAPAMIAPLRPLLRERGAR
jgi:serine/threonine-protein kinase